MSVCPSREEHVRLGSVDPQPAFEVRQWTCSPPARGQPMVSASSLGRTCSPKESQS